MDRSITERAMKIAKMPDGTYHPGALTAMRELYREFGEGDIARIEALGLTFEQVWDLYDNNRKDAAKTHKALYA